MNNVVVIGGMDANVQHAFRGGAVAGAVAGALDIEVIKVVFELQVANGQLRGCVRAAGGGRAVARACAVMCSHF